MPIETSSYIQDLETIAYLNAYLQHLPAESVAKIQRVQGFYKGAEALSPQVIQVFETDRADLFELRLFMINNCENADSQIIQDIQACFNLYKKSVIAK